MTKLVINEFLKTVKQFCSQVQNNAIPFDLRQNQGTIFA